jgi:WD40 repeat protein/tetratricopeptide (TPR) repeat protein
VSWAAAKFSPDSRRIALCHQDGALLIYDLATGRPSRRSSLPWAGDLAFRGDGAQIAVASTDPRNASCHILEVETGRVVRSFPLPVPGGVSVAWSPDGTTLATPCSDSKIYLWEAATGKLRAVLEGSTNGGLIAAFHPAGSLLVSNGWESRLRLWDTILGRPVLSLTAVLHSPTIAFSHDGRIVLSLEDRLTTYQVDPALEYRTLAHVSGDSMGYLMSEVHRDGRVLALAMSRGVALWDLASGRELAFLPIGNAWHLKFEASGDLLTSGDAGVRRWPVRLDADRGEFRIGPPTQLPLPERTGVVAEDRPGRIVAVPYRDHALVATPERPIRVGPLDDCRSVAVSPDGQWLATGSHHRKGAQVWRIRDAAQVAHLPVEGNVSVFFSPDGKWLMTSPSPCRLWAVGTWREAGQSIGGTGLCFSPDSRLVVVQDASKALRLVETESGRTLARLESPDACDAHSATFSPDGSRLVVTTNDGPAVHIWDLRAIRRRLAAMHLDWEAPGEPALEPVAESVPPRSFTAVVDLGGLGDASPPLQQFQGAQAAGKTGEGFNLAEVAALTKLATIYESAGRTREAVPLLAKAYAANPKDTIFSVKVAALQAWFGQEKELAATRQQIQAFARNTTDSGVAERAAKACGILPYTDKVQLEAALALGRKGVELNKGGEWQDWHLLALGMAEYRKGNYASALEALAAAELAGPNVTGISAFYRAMSLFRQGKKDQAREVAIAAVANMKPLPADEQNPLAGGASDNDLIAWLAYKEAQTMIQFDARTPAKAQTDKH